MSFYRSPIMVVAVFVMVVWCGSALGEENILNGKRYYVWDFSAGNDDLNDLAILFTDEFEEALINTRLGIPLERRNYAKLFMQKESEIEIASFEMITDSDLDQLKTLQANFVIFGSVQDDVEGGVIKISVSVQAFDSRVLAKESVLLTRGKRFDTESRQKSMDNLANKLAPGKAQVKSENPGVPLEIYSAGVSYKLTDVARAGNTITFTFIVTAIDKDLTITLYGYYANRHSRLFDDLGGEYYPDFIHFGKQHSKGGVTADLPMGVPLSAKLIFEKINTKAKVFTLLDFASNVKGYGSQEARFRNIRIP